METTKKSGGSSITTFSLIRATVAWMLGFAAACAVFWASYRPEIPASLQGLLFAITVASTFMTLNQLCYRVLPLWYARARDAVTNGRATGTMPRAGGLCVYIGCIALGFGIASWLGVNESSKNDVLPLITIGALALVTYATAEISGLIILARIYRDPPVDE